MLDPDDQLTNEICAKPKINMFMLILFFILTIPIIVFELFEYIGSNINLQIGSTGEIKLENTSRDDESRAYQRKEKLEKICKEFLAITNRYGYTPNEIINEIKKH